MRRARESAREREREKKTSPSSAGRERMRDQYATQSCYFPLISRASFASRFQSTAAILSSVAWNRSINCSTPRSAVKAAQSVGYLTAAVLISGCVDGGDSGDAEHTYGHGDGTLPAQVI